MHAQHGDSIGVILKDTWDASQGENQKLRLLPKVWTFNDDENWKPQGAL